MKANVIPVKKIYYWGSEEGGYRLQIVHNDHYSTLDTAKTKKDIEEMAKTMGYTAEEDNG